MELYQPAYTGLFRFERIAHDSQATKWRWRMFTRSGDMKMESRFFEFLSDCVEDARAHGYF